jgi:hypothetical protein
MGLAGATDAVSCVAGAVGVSMKHVQEDLRSEMSVLKVASGGTNLGEIGPRTAAVSCLTRPHSVCM